MNKHNLAKAATLLLAMTSLPAVSQKNNIRIDPAFSVIADKTNTVHGNDIARVITQLMLIKDLRPLSTLVLSEERKSRSLNILLLSTPLREISKHQYQPAMVRSWEDANSVAEKLLDEATRAGLLLPNASPDKLITFSQGADK